MYYLIDYLYDWSYKWVIPFTYKFEDTRADDKQLIWLNLTDSRIELDANDRNRRKWIYANLDFMGYFRVNYDEQNWLKIAAQLKRDHNKFTALERATLLFDAFTLARYYNRIVEILINSSFFIQIIFVVV